MDANPAGADERLAALQALVTTATQRLLGDTISVTDEQWRAPSLLPGWSRGHVATHIARQAGALAGLARGAVTGRQVPMYASAEQRDADIEAGSGRTGLDLQIDLDTAAGDLAAAFDAVDAADRWDVEVEMRGGVVLPVRLLPAARLSEVVLHHVDLDVGYRIDDVDDATAAALLEIATLRLRHRTDYPLVRISDDAGGSRLIGAPEGSRQEDIPTVTGTPARLLGWLTGRSSADGVHGADGIALPAY